MFFFDQQVERRVFVYWKVFEGWGVESTGGGKRKSYKEKVRE